MEQNTYLYRNSLAKLRPDVAKKWHPTLNFSLTPLDITKCNGKKIWWRHWSRKDMIWHVWIAPVSSLTSKQPQGCAICHGTQIQLGVNDLMTTHPELSGEWHPTKNGETSPFNVSKGSHKKSGGNIFTLDTFIVGKRLYTKEQIKNL